MAGAAWRAVRRFILWDYRRATWHYDVLVGLILAFVFLAPGEWFRDQPRIPQARPIVVLSGARSEVLYWIEAELLAGAATEERSRKAEEILKTQYGKKLELIRLEPVADSDEEVKGYVALTKP